MPGLPYRGFYNGNIQLQMANGTYADFRYMLEARVKLGKLRPEDLAISDKQWEAIPLEERVRRRDLVVKNSTPKEVSLQTHEGTIVVIRTEPDENDNVYKDRQKEKVKKQRKLPAGTLTADNNPLLASVK